MEDIKETVDKVLDEIAAKREEAMGAEKPEQEQGAGADSPKNEREEVTIKFAKGLMEPFTGKDGTDYVRVKIPNRDENDKSPWASFVVNAKAVHENKFGKGMWMKLNADGHTTVSKPRIVGKRVDGKNEYVNDKLIVPNRKLKGMVEFYKEKASLKDNLEQKKAQASEKNAAEPEKTAEKSKQKGKAR